MPTKTAVEVAKEKYWTYGSWQEKISFLKGLEQKVIQALSEDAKLMKDASDIVATHGNTEEFKALKPLKIA